MQSLCTSTPKSLPSAQRKIKCNQRVPDKKKKVTTMEYRGIVTLSGTDTEKGSVSNYRLEPIDLGSVGSVSAEKHDFVLDSVL